MCGYVGAGKSTTARMLAGEQTVVLHRDDLMIRAVGADYDEPVYAERLPEITEFLWELARQISGTGASVVLDWNHWSRERRAESAERARAAGAVPVVQWVRASVEEASRRAANRNASALPRSHVIDPEGVRHSAQTFEEPAADEGLEIVATEWGRDPDDLPRTGVRPV